MNTMLWTGVIIILALAGLGVYLGWAAYHEKGKKIVADAKQEIKDTVNKI